MVLHLVIVLFGFLGIWGLINLILMYSSELNKIEKYYLTYKSPVKMIAGLHSIRIGCSIDPKGLFHKFSWMIRIGMTDSGVYLASLFPFFPSLRPINLPWEDIAIEKALTMGLKKYEICFKKFPESKIILSENVAKQLFAMKDIK